MTNEEKIAEIINRNWENGDEVGLYFEIKKYAKTIRQQTLDEVIACLPEKELEQWTQNMLMITSHEAKSFNHCRSQALSKLEELKLKSK